MDEIQDLFTNDTQTELKPSCIKIIGEKMIATLKQHAKEDGQDPTKAPSHFNRSLCSSQESESRQAVRQNDDIPHALSIATEKKQSRTTFCMGTAQLDFKHKFIATNLDAWGLESNTSSNPRPSNIPCPLATTRKQQGIC